MRPKTRYAQLPTAATPACNSHLDFSGVACYQQSGIAWQVSAGTAQACRKVLCASAFTPMQPLVQPVLVPEHSLDTTADRRTSLCCQHSCRHLLTSLHVS